jgi:MazG family protein
MDDQEMMQCKEPARQMERLRAIMHRLRAPGGCPWDAEQTHESLVSHLIEEAYECVDAIRSGDRAHMKEELGDLLLQVVFHSEIASESGDFTFDEVAAAISDKLVHRHPHVYGDASIQGSDAVLVQWDAIKRAEKGDEHQPYLHGVGKGLPALSRAYKLQKKAAKVGFDWPDLAGVIGKLREEIDELEVELHSGNAGRFSEELGDVFFSMVNVARYRGLDPEVVMAEANKKFEARFTVMEQSLRDEGIEIAHATLEQMESHWQAAKNVKISEIPA